jgi:photosystem II stability/assembly factor-like uncharacterized protein
MRTWITAWVGIVRATALVLSAVGPIALAAADEQPPQMQILPAEQAPGATTAMMLAVARAGTRLVAVGDHGVVLLSDDGGNSFRQAHFVPVSSTLSSVWFADASHGWAVGHWGVVLSSSDGGETWKLQRSDISVDQPLFSVYFKNAKEGWAVGLWSLMLHTVDGGASWTTVTLPPPPGFKRADRNLYQIFADSAGTLYIACEQGRVLRSTDGGATWTYLETGYTGSLWTGVALAHGVVLVGGLRGSIYRSTDGGSTWTRIETNYKSSITDMVQLDQNSIVAVALDGVSFVSHDGGATFTGEQRPDRVALTAVAESPAATAVVFSVNGPIS